MARVLVVDDERKMRRVLQILLEQMGVESVAADSGEEALEHFADERIDLVLTDLKMSGMSGVDLIRQIRTFDSEVPVIVFTAYGTVQAAVEAMKEGAFDFVLKPFDVQAIEGIIRNALEMRRYRTQTRFLREQADHQPSFENLVGVSPAMQSIYDLVRQIAPAKSAVLITGETGTGKELVARALHNVSPRRDQLFVPINCAAIPSELLESELFGHTRGAFTGAQSERTGKFELADGGTLFLDEIGDMAYGLQAKLLRVLQEGVVERIGSNKPIAVNVRVASSTNRDLQLALREGRFREDLYYRLNVFHIQMPPLRERTVDIVPLAAFFLRQFGEEMGKGTIRLSDEAGVHLGRYPFPGNVRELRNLMERAAVLSSRDVVDVELLHTLLPTEARGDVSPAAAGAEDFRLDLAVEGVERKTILRALAASGNNKAETARLLGVSERTLWYKLKRYSL
jgi:two-component system, NtrC family, response regulator AtoC